MSKFTKDPIGLSSNAMSPTERFASKQTSTSQERAAQALAELNGRRMRQAQSLDQNQRRESRNRVKEYDFQSRLASNRYDETDQGQFKMMRTAEDYMGSQGYASRMGSVQRINNDVEYMDEAPYDTTYSRSQHSMFGQVNDLGSILRESMVNKIRADVAKRASKARSEHRVLDERYAERVSDMFDAESDGPLSGLSPNMLNPRSIARGGYEQEAASNFGILNQEQAMRRAAQLEKMRENHSQALDRIQREGIRENTRSHPGRLGTDDETRRQWESLEAQRGSSIQDRLAASNSIFGGDIYGGRREVNGIVF